MRILFLTDNFPPEVNAPAIRTYEHCKEWVKLGHEVTVITCFPNFPKGKVFKGYRNKLISKKTVDGIKVIRVWTFVAPNTKFLRRTIDHFSFAISSFIVGLFISTDKIIATSPQFFTALGGSWLSFFKRTPWVMEVRDLWPNSIVAVGHMKENSRTFRFLKKIELNLYRHASKIVVVTDSFKDYLESYGIDSSKIGVFKNGIVKDNFVSNGNLPVTLKAELKNKTAIGYIGTIGLAHKLDFILECAENLKEEKYHFLIMGDGAKKHELLKLKDKLGLENVSILDGVDRSLVPTYLSICDYSIVNLKKSDEFKKVIPSKIFESIALNKPVLLGVEGEAKILIDKYEVGVCYEPENKESFINALQTISALDTKKVKGNCTKMIKDFDRNSIAKKMLNFIK